MCVWCYYLSQWYIYGVADLGHDLGWVILMYTQQCTQTTLFKIIQHYLCVAVAFWATCKYIYKKK